MAAILRTLSKRRDILIGVPALGMLLAFLTAYIFYPTWKASRDWKEAEAALETRDFEAAAAHLKQYLRAHPASAEAHFTLARAWRRAGRFDDARTALGKAQRLDWIPEQIELEETLLRVQQLGADEADRARLSRYVGVQHPDQRLILEALASGARERVQLAEAKRWLDLWVERFPEDWLPRLWRGEQLQATAHFDAARDDFLKLLELRPDYDEAHLRLGLLALANRSQFAEAENHLQIYLKVHPLHAEALLGLARCRREQGDLDAAALTLKELLDRDPHHAEAVLLTGMVEADRGRYDAALPWLRRAEQKGTDPVTTHFQLALVLKRLGKEEEALSHQRRFQELEKAGLAVDKALLAVLEEPGNPARHYELGRAYAEMGQGANAERYFLGALRLDPTHRPSHEALADYYSRSDRPELATRAEVHRRLAKKEP